VNNNGTTHRPMWQAIRGGYQRARSARRTRSTLQRELGTYTSASDLNDLHAILERYPDHHTAEIRRILASRPVANRAA
jgi:hypothetical protein